MSDIGDPDATLESDTIKRLINKLVEKLGHFNSKEEEFSMFEFDLLNHIASVSDTMSTGLQEAG